MKHKELPAQEFHNLLPLLTFTCNIAGCSAAGQIARTEIQDLAYQYGNAALGFADAKPRTGRLRRVPMRCNHLSAVMPTCVAGIHVFLAVRQ
jgi:hypothetical protein